MPQLSRIQTPALGNSGAELGMRNRFINGSMVIDQRNAGAAVTPAAGTTTLFMDMWRGYNSQGSKYSVQRATASPPPGFSYYANIVSSSAYTIFTSDQFQFTTPIEGLNMADFNWGTANAKTVTLSFWVYSSVVGSFPISLRNAGSPSYRTYVTSYAVTAANTWQQVVLVIPGDTSGGWAIDNTMGLQVTWTLGAGSDFTTSTTNAWQGGNYLGPSSGVINFVSNNAAVLRLTGVQLERGSNASPFEFRPYGTELALCQRYFFATASPMTGSGIGVKGGFASGTGGIVSPIFAPVTMRASPSFNVYNAGVANQLRVSNTGGSVSLTGSVALFGNNGPNGSAGFFYTSGTTAGTAYDYDYTLSAEL